MTSTFPQLKPLQQSYISTYRVDWDDFITLQKWKKLSNPVWAHFWIGMGSGNCHGNCQDMFPELFKSHKASKFVPKNRTVHNTLYPIGRTFT